MDARPPARVARAAAHLVVCSLVVSGTSLVAGCLNRPIAPNDPRTTSTVVERLGQRIDKIDLLLTIDNSRSMEDKQAILAMAVPDLVGRLVNPRCVDPLNPGRSTTPALPSDDCPSGMEREFQPVHDIHIGIISSSLGGHGSPSTCTKRAEMDMAHLLARSDESVEVNDLPTYDNKGFLAWDPAQKLDPAGEAILDDGMGNGLLPTLTNMVKGVGDIGCGYESQLESWYRFLVDPEPYEKIVLKDGQAVPEGRDEVLLQQRKAFLRPDSLLAIIMLSDENDCSIREGGTAYLAAHTTYRDANNNLRDWRMFRPRRECAEKGPDDPCCRSCASDRGECPVDETCGPEGRPATLEKHEDPHNLRCFNQKERFGIDLLYPIERYTKALTSTRIADRHGNLVDNPIFSDLDPTDENSAVRTPDLVFFAGLVGVPWQDIARQNDAGEPDLLAGKDADGNPVGGFKTAAELSRPTAGFTSVWDIILGDPRTRTPPADPHMIESRHPRTGTNPITGTPIADPDSPDDENPINGHEWLAHESPVGDLQYACVFDLRGLDVPATGGDCEAPNLKNPLCEDAPDGTDSPRQVKAKAYPGLRQLQLIRDLGDQGIVGSVCPAQLDPERSGPLDFDFGYRPAMGAIVDRLKTKLNGPCLPRALKPDDKGQVSCLVVEARSVPEGRCDCDALPARREVPATHLAVKRMVLEDPVAGPNGWNCVCEIEQLLDPDELRACQTTRPPAVVEVGGESVHGWCYVDPQGGVGEEEVVAQCPSTQRRLIRLTGEAETLPGAMQFVICSGDSNE